MYEAFVLLYWNEEGAQNVNADYVTAHNAGRFETRTEAEDEGENMLDSGKATYYEVWLQEVTFADTSLVDMVASGGA